MINSGITDNQKAGLTEGFLDLIGECARCKTTSNSGGTSVGCKLEDSTLFEREGTRVI